MSSLPARQVLDFVGRNLGHEIINTAFHAESHEVPGPGVPGSDVLEALPKDTLDRLARRYPALMKKVAAAEGISARALMARLGDEIASAVAAVAPKGSLSDAEISKIGDPRLRNLLWTAAQYARHGKPETKDFDTIVKQRRESAPGFPESICPPDEREPSNDRFVGRASSEPGQPGCSITMISDTVGISAGHCISALAVAEFNVPPSTTGGSTRPADAEDQYRIDPDSIRGVGAGPGDDWVVFRTLPNAITGLQAGAAQAMGQRYYVPRFEAPAVGDAVQITGYGRDSGVRNFAQQSHEGPLVSISGNRLRYTADTEPGNSGSTVRTGEGFREIVGIHTHGGCTFGGNQGTWMSHPALRAAVLAALAEEQREKQSQSR